MTNIEKPIRVPKTIVIVDDHVLFRDGVISLFNSTSDFKIVGEAGSVYEGIERAREHRPDIIIMDFSLPDGTGLDATKTILEELPECKIVFLTVHDADEKLFAAIRAGAKGYVVKDVVGKNLISSLYALEKEEMAISRTKASRIIQEFSHTNTDDAVSQEMVAKLTPRELDVLRKLRPGISNLEIAQQLFISENTVKRHVGGILKKMGVKNRREAIQIAMSAGLKNNPSASREQQKG